MDRPELLEALKGLGPGETMRGQMLDGEGVLVRWSYRRFRCAAPSQPPGSFVWGRPGSGSTATPCSPVSAVAKLAGMTHDGRVEVWT